MLGTLHDAATYITGLPKNSSRPQKTTGKGWTGNVKTVRAT
ncbi:hypothetical protein [Bradyrhizobium genosp. P]